MAIKVMKKSGRHLGWIPDLPDHRDKLFAKHYSLSYSFMDFFANKSVDLRSQFPAVYDQGETNSCTAQAIAAVCSYNMKKENHPVIPPSRLFIYWNERYIENSVNKDEGAIIRDGIKVVAAYGYAPEVDWPFDPRKVLVKPDQKCFDEAQKFRALSYYRLDGTSLRQLRSALLQGHAFVCGITVYPSFENADGNGGIVPMPGQKEKPEGGHCVAIVGFDDKRKTFLLRNSWGKDCGDGTGHYWIPYSYLTNDQLSDDFWVISSVS